MKTNIFAEITCDSPRDPYVSRFSPYYARQQYKLGVEVQYECEFGYKATGRSIKCTVNGWEPKQRCTGNVYI